MCFWQVFQQLLFLNKYIKYVTSKYSDLFLWGNYIRVPSRLCKFSAYTICMLTLKQMHSRQIYFCSSLKSSYKAPSSLKSCEITRDRAAICISICGIIEKSWIRIVVYFIPTRVADHIRALRNFNIRFLGHIFSYCKKHYHKLIGKTLFACQGISDLLKATRRRRRVDREVEIWA